MRKILIENKNIYILDEKDNKERIDERTLLDIIGNELHDIPIKDRDLKLDQNIGYYLGYNKQFEINPGIYL